MPLNTSVSPRWFSILSSSWHRGRRKSASINSTRFPVAAKATALANQRANLTFQRTLGRSTDTLLATLGLSFPADLVAEPEDTSDHGVMRR